MVDDKIKEETPLLPKKQKVACGCNPLIDEELYLCPWCDRRYAICHACREIVDWDTFKCAKCGYAANSLLHRMRKIGKAGMIIIVIVSVIIGFLACAPFPLDPWGGTTIGRLLLEAIKYVVWCIAFAFDGCIYFLVNIIALSVTPPCASNLCRIDPPSVNEWFEKIDVSEFSMRRFVIDGHCPEGHLFFENEDIPCVSVIGHADTLWSMYIENANFESCAKLPYGWRVGEVVWAIKTPDKPGMWLWNVNNSRIDKDPFAIKVKFVSE